MKQIRLATIAVLFAAVLSLAVTGPVSIAAEPAPKNPNIVFILTDDLGINDLGCYGRREHHTPHLDALAAEGTRFTSAYCAQPICSPSRAAIMTGKNPARLHLTTYLPGRPDCPSQKLLHPIIRQQLPLEEMTLPKYLKPAGYVSACIGKWHLGGKGFGPAEQGFDYVHAGRPNTPPSETEGGKGEYDLTAHAIQFIEENRDRPFFLYLAHNTPHIPYTAKASLVAKNSKAFEPVYAALIETLDDVVGLVLAKLDALGLAQNTIVIFSSDNGPEDIEINNATWSGIGSTGPLRGRKRSLYEGGIRLPFIVRWPQGVPAGQVNDHTVVSGADLLPTLCELAGATVPDAVRATLRGQSVAAAWRGDKTFQRTTPLMWEWRFRIFNHPWNRSPMLAIREGKWKLLLNPDRSRVELYDIPADGSEQNNLAGQHADVVASLSEKALAWQKTLPPGMIEPMAGKNNYPWPGKTPPPAAKKGP